MAACTEAHVTRLSAQLPQLPLLPLLMLASVACQSSGRATLSADADGADGSADGLDGADGADTGDGVAGRPTPWIRDEQQSPGSITFTELHVHPVGDADLEWIELHNPMVLDMDVSGWALTGAVAFELPAGTVISAGGFLVVAANPTELFEQAGVAGAAGPWSGALPNPGARVSLVSLSGRRIDTVSYGDDDPWPVGADGSGFTLSKVALDAASDRAEHWAVSTQRGGTPGAANALERLAPSAVRVSIEPDAWGPVEPSGSHPTDDTGMRLVGEDDDTHAISRSFEPVEPRHAAFGRGDRPTPTRSRAGFDLDLDPATMSVWRDCDRDAPIACSLSTETRSLVGPPAVVLHEVPPADGTLAWVELRNQTDTDQPLGELVLTTSSGDAVALPDTTLPPGALWVWDDPGLPLAAGDPLFLTASDGEALLDGVRVGDRGRGRAPGGGPWRFPTAASPGDVNPIAINEDVVINEILYHRAPASRAGEPFAERAEEWLELTHRGDAPIDLSGWQLADAVAYTFPDGTTLAPGGYLVVARDAEALRAAHPGVEVLGDYAGRLGNGGDRILLLDAAGNPADEVRYFDGGRWPWAADGGGSSLELRDPWADNAAAEAWGASDESGRAAWTPVRIRGEAGASVVGPDGVWEELVLGLLDQGEVLIDDVSVVRDPDGARVELLSNGSFDAGADHWRLLGTHQHSAVAPDPDDPSNPVLRLTATGPTGHMHDHAETTLLSPAGTGEVEVSFRARWVAGSNQLHTRLYFNRLPTTTLLDSPASAGTPGAENSVRADNIGPTFDALSQSVAVPEPGEPLGISISVDDPDGVDRVSLWSAVDGAAFTATDMTEAAPGRFDALLPGQAAGAVIQLYVEAWDTLGQPATFPAAGPASRALVAVQGGEGSTTGLHDLRIVMTAADTDRLHRDIHLMSNAPVGATVVYRESEVFYDVGVRLKGSQRGRPSDLRVGYAVRFADDQPFRGSHTSVMIDRSEGVGFGQREVLLNLAMTASGSVSGEHNDLVQLIAPRPLYTGPAELQLDRFSGLVLDAQFDQGSDGTRFEYELIYYPTTTDSGADDGFKLPQPDRVVGAPITDLGDDKEDWRWIWLIKNNARRDDYSAILELGRVFSLPLDPFLDEAAAIIDIDQWLRATAMATLAGVTDQYGGAGSQHNAQFYVRPSDGRVLFFPHDLDFFGSTTMSVVPNGDLDRLIEDPTHSRAYYGHLLDLIEGAYTSAYLGPWCDQLGDLLPGQDFDSHCAYQDARSAFVLEGSSQSVRARFPGVPFELTTNGGEDFTSPRATVTLEGQAWVDVRSIDVIGAADAPALTWLDESTWAVTLTLDPGANPLEMSATDLRGREVGRAAVVVTVESAGAR